MPALALAALGGAYGRPLSAWLAAGVFPLLVVSVFVAVHHAGMPLELGLPPKETVLLATTLLLSVVTLATGRATVLHGAVHLVLFGAFLFLAAVP